MDQASGLADLGLNRRCTIRVIRLCILDIRHRKCMAVNIGCVITGASETNWNRPVLTIAFA